MPNLYALDSQGRTERLPTIHCKDEDTELQRLLAENPHLLPGEQIRPNDPRRWLLVGREVGIDDPCTTSSRWSIDLLLGDQDAIPTLVECKRFCDTRSRREVVGQMLEYAANGHYYWQSQDLLRCAQQTAAEHSTDVQTLIDALVRGTYESPASYFEAMEGNLRAGRVRLVFFLEEAPAELKSIVDFLNRQMEQAEVLIVEARQYQCDETRLVLPCLFGYSEEARRAKESGDRVRPGANGRQWNEQNYFEAASEQLAQDELAAVRQLYELSIDAGLRIQWGKGRTRGSFNVVASALSTLSLLTALSDGELWLNHWPSMNDDTEVAANHIELLNSLRDALGEPHHATAGGSFVYRIEGWVGSLDSLCDVLVRAGAGAGASPDPEA